MKIKSKYKVRHLEDAVKKFQECKRLGTSYMIYDYQTHEYTIELERDVESEADFMRAMLVGIRLNEAILTTEELDALAYADSAIKTLKDMGVIE